MVSSSTFNVIFIGAGEINFGSPEGPWNHSRRLEDILGQRLNVLAIIDPDVDRSKGRIVAKQSDDRVSGCWKVTRTFDSIESAAKVLGKTHVSLIINGCPPHFRGTVRPGKDVDAQLIRHFSDVNAILVEKPIAAADPSTTDCTAVARLYRDCDSIVAVGYMLRYLKIVQRVKSIIEQYRIVPMFINARYLMAYEYANKLSWWNKEVSCGPVVEQATHFVDLIRFLAGSEVDKSTLNTHTVEHHEEAGQLSKLSFDESVINSSNRVPRLTVASWKHRLGTIASLCHGISLHGNTYSTEIDIVADGWLLRLVDLYTSSPTLFITRPGQPTAERISMEDDPFTTQLQTLVSAIDLPQQNEKSILSSYEDALQTYELTWLIRQAGESAAKTTSPSS